MSLTPSGIRRVKDLLTSFPCECDSLGTHYIWHRQSFASRTSWWFGGQWSHWLRSLGKNLLQMSNRAMWRGDVLFQRGQSSTSLQHHTVMLCKLLWQDLVKALNHFCFYFLILLSCHLQPLEITGDMASGWRLGCCLAALVWLKASGGNQVSKGKNTNTWPTYMHKQGRLQSLSQKKAAQPGEEEMSFIAVSGVWEFFGVGGDARPKHTEWHLEKQGRRRGKEDREDTWSTARSALSVLAFFISN